MSRAQELAGAKSGGEATQDEVVASTFSSFATTFVRRSLATRSEAYVCATLWRYVKTKMPAATARNSATSEPRTSWLLAKVSIARAMILGTSRFSALAAIVNATIVRISGAYGFSRPVTFGPAGLAGMAGGFALDTETWSSSTARQRDPVHSSTTRSGRWSDATASSTMLDSTTRQRVAGRMRT